MRKRSTSRDIDPTILAEDLPPENLPETRLCIGCRAARNHDEFQHTPNDPRCVYCVKTDAAKGIEFDREAMSRKLIGELLDATNTPMTSQMPRPSEIAGGLIEELGGLHVFVHTWSENVKKLSHERFGSVAAVKAFNDIGKFILQASRQEDQRDIAEMTNEELVKYRNASVANVFKEMDFNGHRKALTLMMLESLGEDPKELVEMLTGKESEKQEAHNE